MNLLSERTRRRWRSLDPARDTCFEGSQLPSCLPDLLNHCLNDSAEKSKFRDWASRRTVFSLSLMPDRLSNKCFPLTERATCLVAGRTMVCGYGQFTVDRSSPWSRSSRRSAWYACGTTSLTCHHIQFVNQPRCYLAWTESFRVRAPRTFSDKHVPGEKIVC